MGARENRGRKLGRIWGKIGRQGVEHRENRGRDIGRIEGGRIGVGSSAEQGGDEENREWEIGRIGGGRSGE